MPHTKNTFHTRFGPFTVAQIAAHIGAAVEGDETLRLTGVEPLHEAAANSLSFLDNSRYRAQAQSTKAGAVIVRPTERALLPEGATAIVTPHPYAAYAKALQLFYPETVPETAISAQASVAPSAKIGKGCSVGPFAIIEEHAVLGDNVCIGAGSYIGKAVTMGENTRIAPNVTVICAHIGKNVLIHSGVRIGQDGFGFAFDGRNIVKVPQVGHVIIGDDVEIGANTTIDRGALGPTEIGSGTRIDNLVQIGHNVKIGRQCQIVSQAGIAGSTTLGDGVIVGGQSGFAGHIDIAGGTMIAARSGVTKSITQTGQIMAGFPAVPAARWRRMQAAVSRLVRKKPEDTAPANPHTVDPTLI